MRMRKGQVALYLLLVIVAIAVLVFMNLNAYLAVTAKNRAMNAGDSAALAASRHQGDLLNLIGYLNVEHLKLLMPRVVPEGTPRSKEERLAEAGKFVSQQARLTFLGPLEGIRLANEAAKRVGAAGNAHLAALLREHVDEIRSVYMENPDLYPEPWEGAWEEYAAAFSQAIAGGIVAGPDNIDFINASTGHYLMMKQFYNAVAARSWCWFYFNARGLLDSYSSYRDWPPMPSADDKTREARCVNCEVYSLHLTSVVGSARNLFGDAMIEKLSGEKIVKKGPDFLESAFEEDLLDDQNQVWYIYDDGHWRNWWEIDPDGKWKFPVVGRVRPQFDVKGCAAICRVYEDFKDILSNVNGDKEFATREVQWAGAAKPIASVRNMNDEDDVVTAFNNLVVPCEWTSCLVPLDTVGGKDMSTADVDWMHHIKNDLPPYLENGPDALNGGCRYCQILRDWEKEELRSRAREWLKTSSESCIRAQGSGTEAGGTPHGH